VETEHRGTCTRPVSSGHPEEPRHPRLGLVVRNGSIDHEAVSGATALRLGSSAIQNRKEYGIENVAPGLPHPAGHQRTPG